MNLPSQDEPGKGEPGSSSNPIVVDSIQAEYEWIDIHYPEFEVVLQTFSSLKDGVQDFDIINLKNNKGEEREIWFDVTGFFGKTPPLAHNPRIAWALRWLPLPLIVAVIIYVLID